MEGNLSKEGIPGGGSGGDIYNEGGSWYPVYPEISMHSDTETEIYSSKSSNETEGMALPTPSVVMVNDELNLSHI